MAVPYELIVEEDLNLGYDDDIVVTMPGGGTALGTQIGLQTFTAQAFGASRSSTQSITSATLTIVQLNTEDLDVRGWYNPSTYTFTPTVAGIYALVAQLSIASMTGTLTAEIYRDATSVAKMTEVLAAATATLNISALVSSTGAEAFTVKVTQNSGGAINVTAANFGGVLLGKTA